FFFQAEDGIRDYKVTGVQTCALPISDGDERDDLGWNILSDRLHAELHDGAELGGLQLRHARWGVWICITHVAGSCFFARVGVPAALGWCCLDLCGCAAGGANETTDNRSGK